jgi:hypothetical protein
MTVFLPWIGTFGELIRDVLPWLWAHWQPGDIIGGNPAHAALYPTPPDPRLWTLVAAHYPLGFDHHIPANPAEVAIRQVAADLWPHASLRTWAPDGEVYPKPPISLPEPHPVDVVLAPRAKPYADAKNGWPWADLTRVCHERGWTVGLAGSRAESAEVPADVAAWDLDPVGDAVTGTLRLLRGAGVVVTLDSGIGHLASLVDAPQLVLYDHLGDECREVPILDGVPTRMRFADMYRWSRRLCRPVSGDVAAVICAIETVLSGGDLPTYAQVTAAQVERLAAIDPTIRAQFEATGPTSACTADTILRRYQTRHLDDWCRDLGLVPRPNEVIIPAAIGTLVLRPGGTQFTPTSSEPLSPPAQPLPAPENLAVHRCGLCGSCPHWRNDRCGVAGCACAGLGQPDHLLSRCPEGQW